tara:strand:- start:208 stop:426 length:219 start_codon:yes stop_codon:yes gene_type:complete
MNEWILFTIGILIGGMGGVMISALLCASKLGDLNSEIVDLRHTRKLLKDEIIRLGQRSKPKPRKPRPKTKRK